MHQIHKKVSRGPILQNGPAAHELIRSALVLRTSRGGLGGKPQDPWNPDTWNPEVSASKPKSQASNKRKPFQVFRFIPQPCKHATRGELLSGTTTASVSVLCWHKLTSSLHCKPSRRTRFACAMQPAWIRLHVNHDMVYGSRVGRCQAAQPIASKCPTV